MRTTVTLEPDVKALVDRSMRERGLTFKQAVNAAIRDGLTRGGTPRKPFRTPTHALGAPKIDVTKALGLAAELENEEIVRKLAIGK